MVKGFLVGKYAAVLALFLIVFATWNTASAQSANCIEGFKAGEFEGLSGNKTIDGYLIIRKKDKQIESFNNGKSKIISQIEWLTDSTYTLTTTKHVRVAEGCDKIGSIAYCKVIKCDGEFFAVTWEQDGCGSGTAIIRKKR